VATLGILQLLHLEHQRPRMGASAGFRLLRRIGLASYSLYAIHTPVLLLTTWALLRAGQTTYSVQLLVTFATAVLVVGLVYRGIERVFYRPRATTLAQITTDRTENVPASV